MNKEEVVRFLEFKKDSSFSVYLDCRQIKDLRLYKYLKELREEMEARNIDIKNAVDTDNKEHGIWRQISLAKSGY